MADEKRIALGPFGAQIMRNLGRIREHKRVTYAELSAKLTDLNRPIPVVGLRRIEHGDRRVDADDLVALARALGVPPILLLLPLGEEATVNVSADITTSTWDAVKWFMGFAPLAVSSEQEGGRAVSKRYENFRAWESDGQAVQMYWRHETLEVRWAEARGDAANALGLADAARSDEARTKQLAEADRAVQQVAELERALAEHRQYMRRAGVAPPELRTELQHIELQ